MKKILLFFIFLIPFSLVSQTQKKLDSRIVSGFIFFDNKPLYNVNVFVENSTEITASNNKGYYEVKVKTGDIISFSYVGLNNQIILIEDVTTTLNINMKTINKLPKFNQNKALKLGGSNIGSSSIDEAMIIIEAKSLNKNATSLTEAILEKIPFFHTKQNKFGENIIYIKGKELDGPVKWSIDGFSYDIPIPIYISEVKDIIITTSIIHGCKITVNTNVSSSKFKDIDYNNFYFSDSDFYNNDAKKYGRKIKPNPIYIDEFKKIKTSKEALSLYQNQSLTFKKNINYHFNILNYFEKKYTDKNLILKVLLDYEALVANQPEELKAIAYKYQELNEDKKALLVYKKIANLRPKYAQSYRDLSNTFLDLKDYKNASKIYNYYLQKELKIEENDIGDIISSEMMSCYNKGRKDDKSYQKIKINSPDKIIEADARLVFEWNTSEAEFILEFVNPNHQIFEIENSTNRNNELAFDQKEKGYSSKEILFEKLKRGNWYINFTYLGNKQYKPTTLKVTTYYNWGKPNQSKKVDVFEFTLKNKKSQLLKLNRKRL
jgi:hypothetical protein